MGDCGAFTYVKEEVPPVTVEEVTRFYQDAGFDYGASIDHVILDYNPSWDHNLPGIEMVPDKCLKRQDITIELARDFKQHCKKKRVTFEPLGVAQGWSPVSYAKSVSALQKMVTVILHWADGSPEDSRDRRGVIRLLPSITIRYQAPSIWCYASDTHPGIQVDGSGKFR